jgi:hypothetical protein
MYALIYTETPRARTRLRAIMGKNEARSASRPDSRRYFLFATIREFLRGWLASNRRIEIESVSVAVLKSRTPDRIMRPLENSGEAEAAPGSFHGLGRWM